MGLEDLLLAQDGVVSRDQARTCGVSPRAMRGRLGRGLLTAVHPGVYRDRGHPATDRGRVWAAALWGGDHAVVDGPAAAYWYGLLAGLPPRTPIGLTVPHATRRRVPDGVRMRRRDLDGRDRLRLGGIPVIGIGLAVLETAVVLPDGPAFLDRALQTRVPFDVLYDAFCRSIGATGWTRVRDLLAETADRADSRAERRLIGLLRKAGVTGFVRALPFRRWQIDLAFPGPKVAVEFDGWAFHSAPDRFQNDRTKQNALVAAGWTVLRFTWRDLTERPGDVVAQIRRTTS